MSAAIQTIDQDTGLIVNDDHALVPLSEVETFLAMRPPVGTAKELRDRLAALCAYYRGKVEVYNELYEGQLRTERYIGQVLAEMPRAQVGRPEINSDEMSLFPTPTLEDLGFTRKQSSRLQQIAAIPEERFNGYIEAKKNEAERIVKSDLLDLENDTRASTMKPKINRAGDTDEPRGYDACQTPPEAIDPLLPYLPVDWTIWEPACGENSLVEAFYDASREVIGTDILTGHNFFHYEPDAWDCLVTNPPYTIKYEWLERCYQLGKPFALLLPLETIGAKAAQVLMEQHGIQIILLNRRINFKMPNIGWDGSSAQFPVAWFTWGLDLETQIVFGKLP